jgi:proline iminopeptidase
MRASPNATPGAGTRALSRDDYLYPVLVPSRTGRFALDRVHTMYWEECGNPRGVPVVFLHGGPGGGISPDHRRYFDPAFYRIVLYDQRGAGQSTPLGELSDNTTQHLIADLERLRTHLGIEHWAVFGGSWGSTLALAYAETHWEHVSGLVLRGIFLARSWEIRWFMVDMRNVFPEAWRAFAGFLPEAERGDLLASYYRRLTSRDPSVHMPAAHAWSRYESSCSTLLPDPDLVAHFDEDTVALAIARIEAHYFVHGLFLSEDTLLQGVERLRKTPCSIIQGRYDIVCPIRTAYDLHRAWPEAEYVVVPDAGHSAREPGIARELVAATDRFRLKLAPTPR